MKISLINIGPTQDNYLKEGIDLFEKRIRHYISFEMLFVHMPRNMKNAPEIIQKEAEGKILLASLEKIDHPVLLDVNGKQMKSETFADYLQHNMNKSTKHLAFVVGGPFGFSDEVYKTVPERFSLSSMTFSHQIIRLIFLEQLYRAFTILRGEPYHHA